MGQVATFGGRSGKWQIVFGMERNLKCDLSNLLLRWRGWEVQGVGGKYKAPGALSER